MELKLKIIVVVVVGTVVVLWAMVAAAVVYPWMQALMAGAKIPLTRILGMKMRGSDPKLLIPVYITLVHSGEKIPIAEIESIYMANKFAVTNAGDLLRLVRDHTKSQTP